MNRIIEKFNQLNKEKSKAFIPYICYGYPNIKTSENLVLELEKAGSDLVELGFPFSDPLADGPTIQYASQKALENKVTLKKYFCTVKNLRKKTNVPLVIMTYYNIIFNYGIDKFVSDATKVGLDGAIIPDLPAEESSSFSKIASKSGFSLIYLISPTTSQDDMKSIIEKSTGFIYYVSLTGVTGARNKIASKVEKNVKQIKKITDKAVCVGFGISKPSHVEQVIKFADGVIVGSAIVNLIRQNPKRSSLNKAIKSFVKSLARITKS